MSIVGALRSAVQAMSVTQAQFQIASTNIANVGTDGFSRKTAGTETIVVDGVAAGVRLTEIQRQVDAALIRRVREQTTIMGQIEARDDYLVRIQQLFGTLGDNSSIGHTTSRLAEAFEAMATLPDSAASGFGVVDRAVQLTDQLHGMTEELQRMRAEADQEIARAVEEINAQLAQIEDLNHQIVAARNTGAPHGELADKRDLLIGALAKQIDIRVIERTSRRRKWGRASVTAQGLPASPIVRSRSISRPSLLAGGSAR
jgi:flagellar hook-associated protein 1